MILIVYNNFHACVGSIVNRSLRQRVFPSVPRDCRGKKNKMADALVRAAGADGGGTTAQATVVPSAELSHSRVDSAPASAIGSYKERYRVAGWHRHVAVSIFGASPLSPYGYAGDGVMFRIAIGKTGWSCSTHKTETRTISSRPQWQQDRAGRRVRRWD